MNLALYKEPIMGRVFLQRQFSCSSTAQLSLQWWLISLSSTRASSALVYTSTCLEISFAKQISQLFSNSIWSSHNTSRMNSNSWQNYHINGSHQVLEEVLALPWNFVSWVSLSLCYVKYLSITVFQDTLKWPIKLCLQHQRFFQPKVPNSSTFIPRDSSRSLKAAWLDSLEWWPRFWCFHFLLLRENTLTKAT